MPILKGMDTPRPRPMGEAASPVNPASSQKAPATKPAVTRRTRTWPTALLGLGTTLIVGGGLIASDSASRRYALDQLPPAVTKRVVAYTCSNLPIKKEQLRQYICESLDQLAAADMDELVELSRKLKNKQPFSMAEISRLETLLNQATGTFTTEDLNQALRIADLNVKDTIKKTVGIAQKTTALYGAKIGCFTPVKIVGKIFTPKETDIKVDAVCAFQKGVKPKDMQALATQAQSVLEKPDNAADMLALRDAALPFFDRLSDKQQDDFITAFAQQAGLQPEVLKVFYKLARNFQPAEKRASYQPAPETLSR